MLIRHYKYGTKIAHTALHSANARAATRRPASSWGSPLLYRDLFIFDDSWTQDQWYQGVITGNKNLQHPKSTHVSAQYAFYQFNYSSYHFNEGEFSLHVHPAHMQPAPAIAAPASTHAPAPATALAHAHAHADGGATHSCILWPDRLLIRGLQSRDVKTIMDAAMKVGPALSAQAMERALGKSRTTSSTIASTGTSSAQGSDSALQVTYLDSLVIAVACGQTQNSTRPHTEATLQKAVRTVDTFRAILMNMASSVPRMPYIAMTADMRGHRRGQSVLLLPPAEGLQSTGTVTGNPSSFKEDAFALLDTPKQVQEALRKYYPT